jgi:SAM-dependent methyltransferase
MHLACRAFVADALDRLPEPRAVVELGSRDINGGTRDLLPAGCRYVGVDLTDGPGVDVVADAAVYDPPFAPDLILCTEVLEHTPDGEAILRNAHRMLAPYGALIVTCAGEGRAPHSGVDGGALRAHEHYANVREADLYRWLAPFARVQTQLDLGAGDLRAVAIKGVV